jgi:hypothetical protein
MPAESPFLFPLIFDPSEDDRTYKGILGDHVGQYWRPHPSNALLQKMKFARRDEQMHQSFSFINVQRPFSAIMLAGRKIRIRQ